MHRKTTKYPTFKDGEIPTIEVTEHAPLIKTGDAVVDLLAEARSYAELCGVAGDNYTGGLLTKLVRVIEVIGGEMRRLQRLKTNHPPKGTPTNES